MACRNATILAAEPAALIRIDKDLYRRTLYEMQVNLLFIAPLHGSPVSVNIQVHKTMNKGCHTKCRNRLQWSTRTACALQ